MNDYSSNGGLGIGEDLGYGCRGGEEWKGRRWGRSGLEREIRRRLHILGEPGRRRRYETLGFSG